jgi:hypothetical protein
MKRSSIFILLSICILLGSCKHTSSPTYAVGTGNGNIYGYIYLRDSLTGNDISPRDFTGISIAIQGGPQSTQTTIDGQYEIGSVPEGSPFTLLFSKPGFAPHYDISHTFSPTNSGSSIEYYNTVLLYQIRQLTPEIILRPFVAPNGADTPRTVAVFTGNITDSLPAKQQYSGYMKLFFSTSKVISAADPSTYQYTMPLAAVDAQSGSAEIFVYRDSLLNNGFHSSDSVFCTAYYTGFYTKNEFYIDKASGKRIYTGLSPFRSLVRNFILP